MDELIARLRAVSETGCDPDLPHEAADAIEVLVRRAEDAEQLATARGHTINGLRNELQAARLERDDIEVVLELERMRLAACGVVALSDTPESAAKSRAMNDEYRSASCDDVARRVDECMALRAERDSLVAKLKELEGQEPALYVQSNHVTNAKFGPFLSRACAQPMDGIAATEFFARPVPAEPVNARLAEMANQCRLDLVAQLHEIADHIERIQYCIRDEDARKQIVGQMRYAIGVSSKWNQNGNPFIAAAEAQQAEPIDGRVIDRAWARFCGAFGDGPDAPYPGMIAAFETHYGQSFRDREWRTESACWAAAWHRATEHAAKQTEPVRLTGDQLEGLVKWYGEEPNIYLDRREYARTIQDEVLRANGFKVEG